MIARCVVSPPLSVTVAVIVCVPAVSAFVNDPPVPIDPSMFERQASRLVSNPSCVSLADPEKVTVLPAVTVVPLVGAVIDGAAASTP